MRILNSRDKRDRVLVLLFGQGLIGGSIYRALQGHRVWNTYDSPFSWENDDTQIGDLKRVESWLDRADRRDCSIHLVWSAGTAGFEASNEGIANELRSFERVVEFTDLVLPLLSGGETHIHFISSAGGLFEGVRGISPETIPAPKRPYGRLKLEQERLVEGLNSSVFRHTYRPTSVYSTLQANKRCGLIPTLIWNTLRNRESMIFGRYTTLRDFVWADDIGDFIARKILFPGSAERHEQLLLASGTPTTILRIVRLVEDALMRPVPVRFSEVVHNQADITVDPRCLPTDLHTTDVASAIRRICSQLLCQGVRP
jgi:UDP-glucose 4-epimerase